MLFTLTSSLIFLWISQFGTPPEASIPKNHAQTSQPSAHES
jgi:hypothetical protein